jgi:hypothetical protein
MGGRETKNSPQMGSRVSEESNHTQQSRNYSSLTNNFNSNNLNPNRGTSRLMRESKTRNVAE